MLAVVKENGCYIVDTGEPTLYFTDEDFERIISSPELAHLCWMVTRSDLVIGTLGEATEDMIYKDKEPQNIEEVPEEKVGEELGFYEQITK